MANRMDNRQADRLINRREDETDRLTETEQADRETDKQIG